MFLNTDNEETTMKTMYETLRTAAREAVLRLGIDAIVRMGRVTSVLEETTNIETPQDTDSRFYDWAAAQEREEQEKRFAERRRQEGQIWYAADDTTLQEAHACVPCIEPITVGYARNITPVQPGAENYLIAMYSQLKNQQS